VSHCLTNQITTVVDGEGAMRVRQDALLAAAVAGWRGGGAAGNGQNPSLTFFHVPCNSDQAILSVGDAYVLPNARGGLRYLAWILADAVVALAHYRSWASAAAPSVIGVPPLDRLLDPAHHHRVLRRRYVAQAPLVDALVSPGGGAAVGVGGVLSGIAARVDGLLAGGDGVTDAEELPYAQSVARVSLAFLASVTGAAGAHARAVVEQGGAAAAAAGPYAAALERLTACVVLLRSVLHGEVFATRNGEIDYDFYASSETAPEYGQARRRFTRASSLLQLALLDYLLGAAVFSNCKSGLDRTGLYVGGAQAVIALWEQHPLRRADVVLALTNYNILRGRVQDALDHGTEPSFLPLLRGRPLVAREGGAAAPALSPAASPTTSSDSQSGTPARSDSSEGGCDKGKGPQRLSASGPCAAAHSPVRGVRAEAGPQGLGADHPEPAAGQGEVGEWVVVPSDEADDLCAFLRRQLEQHYDVHLDGRTAELARLASLFHTIRNHVLYFTTSANAAVTVASTGVRGMKIRRHALAGHLLPAIVARDEDVNAAPHRIVEPSVGAMGRVLSLNNVGESLVVDCAYLRKS